MSDNSKTAAFDPRVMDLRCEITDRIHALKENFFAGEERWVLERGSLITDAYETYEAEHLYVKRAKAFAHILDNRTIYIQDGELIAGNYAGVHSAYELYPEYSLQDLPARYVHFKMETLLTEEAFPNPEEKKEFNRIRDFWRGRNMRDITDAAMPEEILSIRDCDICGNPYGRDEGQGHVVVRYDQVVKEGLRPIIDRAQARLNEVGHHDPKAYHFLTSVIISLEAVIRYAHRYATLATELADQETDPVRKQELRTMADNFLHAPEHPAETYWQGLQVTWLVHKLMHTEQNGFSISVGRLDKYLYPLYKADIGKGALTPEFAFELTQNFYVKCMEITIGGQKISLTQTVTLGGRDADGNDESNEVSLLCIKADRATQMVQPQTTLRWHKNINPLLLEEILEGTVLGQATYAVVNDEVLVPGLEQWDIKPEDALEYALIGCNETEIPGKLVGGGLCRPVVVSRVLDVTLHGGQYRYADTLAERAPEADAAWRESGEKGRQIGVPCKRLGEYETFEEIIDAFRSQYAFFARKLTLAANIMDNAHATYRPLPFASSLMDGCIERGKDMMEQTEYFHWAVGVYDIVPTVNALAAIKRCVFEEKSVTQEELLAAIDNNWQGHEHVRAKLLKAPKFGNDDDFVDQFVEQITTLCLKELSQYRSWRNNSKAFLECIARAAHVYTGSHTKALPDGRSDWEAMPPSLSATAGTDVNGPTAYLNSVAKAPSDHLVGGTISNIRFHPDLVKDKASRQKALQLLHAYFLKGGMHIQINCVSKDTLLAARKDPAKYRDLLVRVSGYVDYWTNLDEKTQDEVISRTVIDV